MSVATAVDGLYAAFGPVPRPVAISHCPCCFSAAYGQSLLDHADLRELSATPCAGTPATSCS